MTAHHQPGRLTDPEVHVLSLAAQGLTNAAIARKLGIPPATVKERLARARRLLGAPNTTAAVAVAIIRKLIP